MARMTALRGLGAGCVLLWAYVAPVWADPTVAQILNFKPGQDVQITTPAPDEYNSCEVQAVKNKKGSVIGWLLLDANKKPLRRFIATRDEKNIDLWSYFKDGEEVYRELDTNANKRPDQYRWLNSAGMKWGISTKEDGRIDRWQMISAEEAGQEVFHALATNDFRRIEALFITEAEMKTLKLPAAEIERVTGLQKQAQSRFKTMRGKIPDLDEKAQFLRVEAVAPVCVPHEAFGGEVDVIKFNSRAILFETAGAKKKEEWIQSGEMVQVGLSWRLIDGPGLQDVPAPPQSNDVAKDNPKLREQLDELAKLDRKGTNLKQSDKEGQQAYNIQRVDLIEKILPLDEAKNVDIWRRQICDGLSAAQAGHKTALARLTQYREDFEKKHPKSNVAAYAAYRELWAIYGPKLNPTDSAKPVPVDVYNKLQEEWHDKLAKFVQLYPDADDTPDAIGQLAMGSEFSGKDEEAKRWNKELYTRFPNHYLAEKARGAERRLSLVGNPLVLAGTKLGGGDFNITQLKGKMIAVYFWASNVEPCVADFETLKRLHKAYSEKGFEIVCVSLDDKAADVSAFLKRATVSATHLFQECKDGGMNSPLATYFGIHGLPTLFLVGRNGNVINRSLQVGELEAELKKGL